MKLDISQAEFKPVRVTRNGRRYFSAQQKRQLIERCLQPGASVASVAMDHRINANLLRRWMREYQARGLNSATKLLPVRLSEAKLGRERTRDAMDVVPERPTQSIEIQIGTARVSVGPHSDIDTLQVVLGTLLRSR